MNTILIPYRDRDTHLASFIDNYRKCSPSLNIVIIEQIDGKLFNRGKLLNVGVDYHRSEYYILHDVDYLPNMKTFRQYEITTDNIVRYYSGHEESLGGMCYISYKNYMKINGHPNHIWGWGIEDRALYYRSQIFGINITNANIKGMEYYRLKHPSNIVQYIDEKLRISDIENAVYDSGDIDIQLKHIFKSGMNNLEYNIVEEQFIDDNITKIIVDI